MVIRYDLINEFYALEGSKVQVIGKIGLVLEDNYVDSIEKIKLLKAIDDYHDNMSNEEVIASLWAIGKWSNSYSIELLLKFSKNILSKDIAWQYLVSYENIVGNTIRGEFLIAFKKIDEYSDSCKISQALQRFNLYDGEYNILVKNQSGLEKYISVVNLVKSNAKLCSAKLIPPFKMVREFLLSGSAVYSYWEDVCWDAFELSEHDYNTLCDDLMNIYNFKDVEGKDTFDDLGWETMQTAVLFDMQFDDVVFHVKKQTYIKGC